jgi:hypothetical protein
LLQFYFFLDFLPFLPFFFGTFAPFRRALDNPIAIACFRDFTLCFPLFLCRISVATDLLALLEYFRFLFFAMDLLP